MGQVVDRGGARDGREFSLPPPLTRIPGLTSSHSAKPLESGESDTWQPHPSLRPQPIRRLQRADGYPVIALSAGLLAMNLVGRCKCDRRIAARSNACAERSSCTASCRTVCADTVHTVGIRLPLYGTSTYTADASFALRRSGGRNPRFWLT